MYDSKTRSEWSPQPFTISIIKQAHKGKNQRKDFVSTGLDVRPYFVRARRRFVLMTTLVAMILVYSVGCNSVKRRLTITSEPSGALVYLNDKEIGRTPISQNFVYSGVYKIRCFKEGYETEETYYKAGTPWYLYPGIDFFSENFVPGEIRDEQHCHIELTSKRQIPMDEINESATRLREEAHNQFRNE